MKVFITGLGSDLGTGIARILEQKTDVTGIAGVDLFPPRRYLARTKFYMTRYDDSERIADIITHFSPDVIINFGVYEPGARLGSARAQAATHASVAGIIHATHALDNSRSIHVVTRSSVIAYGFSEPFRSKDETSPLSPDTYYGEMCQDIEEKLTNTLARVTVVRTAPELSAHIPHPLARLLSLPAIPVQARLPFQRDIGFPVIASRDAMDLFVRAALSPVEEGTFHRVLHAATSSNATMLMAAHIGKKVPVFITGATMPFVRQGFYLAGAPIAPHIEMLLRRGMLVDSTATRMRLGITTQDSPSQILKNLFSAGEVASDVFSLTEAPR